MVIHGDKVEGEVPPTDFNELLGTEVVAKVDLYFIHRWKEAFQVVRSIPITDVGVPVVHIDDILGYLIERNIKADSPDWNILYNGIDGLDSGLIVCHGPGRPDEAGWGPIPVTWSTFEELLEHMHKVSIIKDWIEGGDPEKSARQNAIHSEGHGILGRFLENYQGTGQEFDQLTLESQWEEYLSNHRASIDTDTLMGFHPDKFYQRLLDTTPWEQWPLRILDNVTAIRRTRLLAGDIEAGLKFISTNPTTLPNLLAELHAKYDAKEWIPSMLASELKRELPDCSKGWESYFPQPKKITPSEPVDRLDDNSVGDLSGKDGEYQFGDLFRSEMDQQELFTKQEVLRIIKALNPELVSVLPLLKRLG